MNLPNDVEERMRLRARLIDEMERRTCSIQAAIDTILAYMQAEINRIESEFGFTRQEIEDSIRADVLVAGESLSIGGWECRYRSGSITWDTRGLEGYAKLAPEVLAFRKEGKPSAAFYVVKTDQPGL